jgi:hypothetical protein
MMQGSDWNRRMRCNDGSRSAQRNRDARGLGLEEHSVALEGTLTNGILRPRECDDRCGRVSRALHRGQVLEPRSAACDVRGIVPSQ